MAVYKGLFHSWVGNSMRKNILAFCPAEILHFHWKCHTSKLAGDVDLEIIKTEKLLIPLSPFLFIVGSSGSNQKSKCIFPLIIKKFIFPYFFSWCIKNIQGTRQNHHAFQNILLTMERLPRNSPSTFLLALSLLTVSQQCRFKLEHSWSDSSEISPLLYVHCKHKTNAIQHFYLGNHGKLQKLIWSRWQNDSD